MNEASWRSIVQERLGIGRDLLDGIRRDLESRETRDDVLVSCVRGLRGTAKTAIVSNAWPRMHTRMSSGGLLDVVDVVVLSCGVGYAKPDPRIYEVALQRIGADSAGVLFIDDTPGHVSTAEMLSMAGHVHTDVEDTVTRIGQFLRLPGWGRPAPRGLVGLSPVASVLRGLVPGAEYLP
ncbi:HAD-IA family hydrolase [Kitasatospora sp. NPDC056138]|uniref:HAD-IA family hydrolase n=1 Tax=Kitasatospora sp. NPDC056138 TaxID=3345724 RepID=UPI0035DA9FEF